MFAPLTEVKSAHHQATGFVQASELGRARHCELMIQFLHVTKLTSNRINSVTLWFLSRPKNCDSEAPSGARRGEIGRAEAERPALDPEERKEHGLGRSPGFIPLRGIGCGRFSSLARRQVSMRRD